MRDETCVALEGLFFGSTCRHERDGTYVLERAEEFPIATLIKACEILGCKPDELFTSFDAYDESGCETCGPSITRELSLRVNRK